MSTTNQSRVARPSEATPFTSHGVSQNGSALTRISWMPEKVRSAAPLVVNRRSVQRIARATGRNGNEARWA